MSTSWKDDPRFSDRPNLRSVGLVLVMALAFLSTFLMIRNFSVRPASGAKADYSWKVTDLSGKPVDLKAYRNRAVFLNVWATWCGPCREEMPSIARLMSDPKLKDVAFLCVSSETAEPVEAYIARMKPPMTMLLATGPPPPVFATDAIPATYLIAPGGRIVRSQVGSMEWDTPANARMLEEMVREAK